jgi:hypothetical protein
MTVSTGLEPLLSAEHAAIYGYGLAGAVLVRTQASITMLNAARSGLDAHRQTRDQLADSIAAGGGTPPPPQAAYQVPFDVTDPASALRLLALLEDRVAATAAYAVANTDGVRRKLAADLLSTCAARGARLRLLMGTTAPGVAIAFPGLPAS